MVVAAMMFFPNLASGLLPLLASALSSSPLPSWISLSSLCTLARRSLGLFTVSIYDMMMELGKLPYLPRVQTSALYSLCAKDVMHTDFSCLTLSSTLRDAISLLAQRRLSFEDSASVPQFPLVVSRDNMLFLGSVARDDLERYVLRDPRVSALVDRSKFSALDPKPGACTPRLGHWVGL